VLVVDDSPLFAQLIAEMIEGDPELEVIGIARDGKEAVEMVAAHRPDLVTMDIQMPVMDGLMAIEQIMARHPTPILVLTADPRGYSGELSMEALRSGALDLVVKPASWPVSKAEQNDLAHRIKLLASVRVVRHVAGGRRDRARVAGLDPLRGAVPGRMIGLVASTGGPAALATILADLPRGLSAGIAVVQHMGTGFTNTLAAWLDRTTPLDVRVAVAGAPVEPGVVVIAPDGAHLTITRRGRVQLERGRRVNGHCPSGTVLLESLAHSFGTSALGVVLTGMGRDGADGLRIIRDRGGVALAQDEETSAVYGMPKAAMESAAAQRALPLPRVASALRHFAERGETLPLRSGPQ